MAKGKGKSPAKKTKKRNMKVESEGMAYIQASFNNIIISLTNKRGQVISWASAGKAGFRGSKKNTPYAAQVAAADASRTAYDAGLRSVEVFVKGPGSGREAAIRAIDVAGIKVSRIKDVTPVPHNGCRPPKRRRV
jgi:small subunit ribosomal protein S11